MSTIIAARSAARSAQLSALDQRLVALGHDHAGHSAGPILPCPLCFDPSLAVPSEPAVAGPLTQPVSIAEPTRRAAAA